MNKRETSRLIIVANRLPVTISRSNQIQPCSGGLVSAMNSFLSQNTDGQPSDFESVFWAGCPGCPATVWDALSADLPTGNYSYIPVYASEKEYEGYYNGFSNSTLWPLFHYFPSLTEYSDDQFENYLSVNQLFCQSLLKHLRPTDTVWIHDYHLLPLAAMLRKSMPGLTISFFLHIPFPSYEIFRLLPRTWQHALLEGMLGADLIGFHTVDYAAHFLQSVQSVLGVDHNLHTIQYQNRLVKADVFPISIDYSRFHEAYDDPQIIRDRGKILDKFTAKKIIFSIDRLDYTKGVYNRLKGYEYFLQNNPEYHNKVVMVVVVIPSRDMIGKYSDRKKMIDEMISRINSRLGTLHWQPVIYRYTSLSFEELLALYTCADVALVTPLRDGMNLIAKEFVASRKDQRGVLILSEMAGAARELTEAVMVNPNDVKEISRSIKIALEMNPLEQAERMKIMQQRIRSYDVSAWGKDFLQQLSNMKKRQQAYQIAFLDEFSMRELVSAYRDAEKKLLLLDYDGTLVPFASKPEDAVPGSELLELIEKLCSDIRNEVYIISGRDAAFLEKWFGNIPVNLIAEHGASLKLTDGGWVSKIIHSEDWKKNINQIMETYCERCPLTFVEEKEYSVAWHYRNANQDQARLRCSELLTQLNEYTHNLDLQVLMGNKVIEVRNQGINKGIPVKNLLDENYDFILAAGDDETDEDVFRVLYGSKNCFTIKIGSSASFATFNLSNPTMMISLLKMISHYTIPVAAVS